MPYPPPKFPFLVWDGLTANLDRVDINSNVNPDASDWERVASEVIAIQQNGSAVLLPPVTGDGPLVITDPDGVDQPLTTSAVILADATTASFTIDIPAAATMTGQCLTIKKIDPSAKTVTVDGDGTETIDGGLTQVIGTQYVSITILSDGTEWFIL